MDNSAAILRQFAPTLEFSAQYERFLPMQVEWFYQNASLRLDYRLFGLYSLRSQDLGDLSQHMMPEYALIAEVSEPNRLWDLLTRLPFIKKEKSLVFLREDEISAHKTRGMRAPPATRRAKVVHTSMQTLLWISILLTGATLFLSASWEVDVLLAVGLFLLAGFLGLRKQLTGLGIFSVGLAQLGANVIFAFAPPWIRYALFAAGLLVGLAFILADNFDRLDNLIGMFSPLDRHTGKAAHSKYMALALLNNLRQLAQDIETPPYDTLIPADIQEEIRALRAKYLKKAALRPQGEDLSVLFQALMWLPLIGIGIAYFVFDISKLSAALLLILVYSLLILFGAFAGPAWSSWERPRPCAAASAPSRSGSTTSPRKRHAVEAHPRVPHSGIQHSLTFVLQCTWPGKSPLGHTVAAVDRIQ